MWFYVDIIPVSYTHLDVYKRQDEPGAGKGLYLLSFLYRKNIWRTVSIVFLSLATAFTLAYAMTYVYDAGKMERYINRVFPNDMYRSLRHISRRARA